MENYSSENSALRTPAGVEQFRSISKWSKFVGIVFIIFASILLISTVLLIANYTALMDAIISLNSIDQEMIDMLDKGGKYFIAFALVLSATILFINGILIYRFGNNSSQYIQYNNETTLVSSFDSLKQYLYFSFVLGCISVGLSFLSMLLFLGGK